GKEFHGTGDVFASLFISRMLKNNDVMESTLYAMQTVAAMIKRNMGNNDLFDGLNLGICLDLLN
ncbi:MAG TPA: phosphomethylpyrimidine kinase, partial [Succinivibrionaceae bacterium]|nr:phosphomethylpyrimidine kinase [Succinivibrionaceae bacterium]